MQSNEYIKKQAVYEILDRMKRIRDRDTAGLISDAVSASIRCVEGNVIVTRAADVVPVRHGRWIEVEVKELAYYKMMIASMRCDQCGRYHNEVYHYGNPTGMAKYCGFCGALMDKDGDEE